ncbi:MAG: C10 family peptidase, partial [Kiritimatiellaeota bacterium]|nr:C10 family peptidase [Kiritimatiellota bacterium]
MKRRLGMFVALGLMVASAVQAAPVTQGEAERAVQAYLARTPSPLGAKVGPGPRKVRTFNRQDGDTPLFHVVALEGGGFIVTSADTGVSPIIAIADGEDLVESEENQLWVLLNRDLPQRMDALGQALPMMAPAGDGDKGKLPPEYQWALLLEEIEMPLLAAGEGEDAISDVRVEPIVLSTWNQFTVGGLNVYNYYTPNNYLCGCVVTAGAQVMRHHQYPVTPVAQSTLTCYVNGDPQDLTMKGGVYDWANMPLTPTSSITDIQREAIGRLTYDLGVVSQMKYAEGGSGAWNYQMVDAMKTYFGYASGFSYRLNPTTSNPADNADVRNAMLGSLDAGLPTVLSISRVGGGHSIVADGYGYQSGVLYAHLNMGWGGSQDAWYNMANFDVSSSYHYSSFDGVSFNIAPALDKVGEWITGRTLNSSGTPLSGSTVTAKNTSDGETYAAVSNAKGVYAIRVPSSTATYDVSAVNGGLSASGVTVSVQASATCYYRREGTIMYINHSLLGVVGNRWGNDLVFPPPPSTVYVNIAQPDDTGDGRTWTTAKRAIQAGVDTVAVGGTVIVTNGIYAPISTANKLITITSVNGAEVTIIDGGGTSRCATLGTTTGDTNTVLTSFTLRNGYTASEGGGSYYGTLNYCVLTNNISLYYGGGSCYGTLNNCTLTGNMATYGGGADSSTLNNCTLLGNSADSGGGSIYGTLNNCTLTGNTAKNSGGGAQLCTLNNCIVWGNSATYGSSYNHYGSTLSYSCTAPLPSGTDDGGSNISFDPLFVNASAGNFRLQSGSPCIDTGSNAYAVGDYDLDGNPRIINGTVDMGAYEFGLTETQTTPVPVPYWWLDQVYPANDRAYLTYETLANSVGANGYTVWESYVAGLDPTNATSKFRITHFVVGNVNGKDIVTTLAWMPNYE